MADVRLDAVGVTARDIARSVAFYSELGFVFAAFRAHDQHVEGQTGPQGVRLMIDAADLAESLIGAPPRPANHAQFAMLCADASQVDTLTERVAKAGFDVAVAPFDAPWGQRYATVADPDGYLVDLFAPL